jgi:beta-phosphoglucomutase
MIQTIIFDFDGVVLESVSVKTDAFRKLFSFSSAHLEEIVQFHIDNGGMSRFDKFRYIYTYILKEDLTPEKFESLSKKFASIVFEEVIKVPYVSGACEFLETYHSKIPLYIVSATPEEELNQIIQKRGLSRYLRKTFGAPKKKGECIEEILKSGNYSPEQVIFVGDAKNDFEAAHAAGIRFIARVKPGDDNRFKGLVGVEVEIPDLYELTRYIEVCR